MATNTDSDRRNSGGGKLSRSETVTVRLDPKLRYLADLASRRQRRSLSSFIEWAIADSLNRVELSASKDLSVADEAGELWDVDDADRFAKLAFAHPDLLTHEEQVRWKLIRENGYLWKGSYAGHREKTWTWTVQESSLVYGRLREKWDAFCEAAETGEISGLPSWPKTEPSGGASTSPPASAKKPSSGFDDMDDDIPF